MIHHKHTRLTFLSIFFALPGVLSLALLLGEHVWRAGYLRQALAEAQAIGDQTVLYVLGAAGLAYGALLVPSFIILKKMEHEPYARRVRLMLVMLACFNVFLFISAGSSSILIVIAGFFVISLMGLMLDRTFPHYL